MTVRERILSIKLIDKVRINQKLAKKIGLSYQIKHDMSSLKSIKRKSNVGKEILLC